MFAVGVALVIGCGATTMISTVRQDAVEQAQRRADDQSADQLQLARELPANPPDAVSTFVDLLGEGGPFAAQEGCMLFTGEAASQFAADHRASSCIVAMQQLHGLVNDPAAYVNDLTIPETAWTQTGTTASVNGCAVNWSGSLADPSDQAPGPLPGVWMLNQLDGEGWQITQYQPC
jgi:hypothetical protein